MESVNAENSSSSKGKGGEASTQKTITAAVLGVPSTHGLKLSLNMTSRDKQDLLCKLEEWRKARREKLASTILSKNKGVEKAKTVAVVPKPKPANNTSEMCTLKNDSGKESVFERLYKSSIKVKKDPDPLPVRHSHLIKNRFSSVPTFQSSKGVKPNVPGKSFQCKPNPVQVVHTTLEPKPVSSSRETFENVELPRSDSGAVFEENSTELEVEGIREVESIPLSPKSDVCNEVSQKEKVVEVPVSESVQSEHENECQEEVVITERGNCNFTAENNTTNEKNELSSAVVQCSDSVDEDKSSKGPATSESSSLPEKEEAKPITIDVTKKSLAGPPCGKERPKVPLRRSISMLYRSKRPPESAIHRTVSENNLKELETRKSVRPSMGPSDSRSQTKAVTLATTSLETPRKTHLLSSDYLRNKLEDWLKVNGHPLEGYRHLRCFGVGSLGKPLSKEKPVARSVFPDDEAGAAASADDSDKENSTPPPTVIRQIDDAQVENWLKELYRLISELKYPADRCEEWLAAIRRKCASCTQMPIYWECLAALDEARGDVESAVEHYEKAIIKGKDVDSVGDALAQLFDKMVIEQGKPSKSKLEKGLDPKNIFKSTIIKFALQQKALKESGSAAKRKQLVATPVRRSTRIQTPLKDHVVSSLHALTPELRSNVTFKPNESLINGQ